MIVVIPAYEPNEKLLRLIDQIRQHSNYRILIVNDGSRESCQSIFVQAAGRGCIVLAHQGNRGKGEALKTAFSYIFDHHPEEDGIVCADCDGQHRWEDIQRIAEALPSNPNAIILGGRKFMGKIPLKSLIGNTVTRTVFSFVSGYQISDTQTGLRGFSIYMLPWLLGLNGERYEYEMNQLLEAKSAGYTVHSIPIQTIYENNNKGSHFRPLQDSIRIYLPILKFSFSSFSCGVIDLILFFIINWLTGNLMLSVIGARVISSLSNYLVNKNFVFKSKKELHAKAVLKYYALAVFILVGNYVLIRFLSDASNLSLFSSKVFTEGILFVISYYTQRNYIF